MCGVFVDDDPRIAQIAEALIAAAARWAAEQAGAEELRLFVHEDNARAWAFYRRLGFTESGHHPLGNATGATGTTCAGTARVICSPRSRWAEEDSRRSARLTAAAARRTAEASAERISSASRSTATHGPLCRSRKLTAEVGSVTAIAVCPFRRSYGT